MIKNGTKYSFRDIYEYLGGYTTRLKDKICIHSEPGHYYDSIYISDSELFEKVKPKEWPLKRFSFNFKSGGWNTVMAKTKRGAYKVACKQWKGSNNLEPDKTTFNTCDNKQYDELIRMTN